MKEYDAIVIGSGCGMNIVMEALAHKLKVALVDKGPLGGTCPNLGCIPSKMLIHVADRMLDAADSRRLGLRLDLPVPDFLAIMERMRKGVREIQEQIRSGLGQPGSGLDFYEGEGHFTGEYTFEVNGQRLQAKRVFIASGSRPLVPPIPGLDTVEVLTSESLLQLNERPESLLIIGGGYVGAEYGHFFAAMGTRVVIVEISDRLVAAEEPEVSQLLRDELSSRMTIFTNATIERVFPAAGGISATVRVAGAEHAVVAQKILVAAGRKSNADLLDVARGGISTDRNGWVSVNEYLETNQKNVVAVGDANGRYMFTHVANKEAVVAAHNAVHGAHLKMDYTAAPHAVYSRPQIASVGMTQAEAAKKYKLLVGRADYTEVAKGEAMMAEQGFAKAIVDKEKGQLLGFHIIGPYAPMIIQEAINAMSAGGSIDLIRSGMHIHPELPELMPRTLADLQEA